MEHTFHFMMNQPGFNRGNVLATLFRFIAMIDPEHKRFEELFRYHDMTCMQTPSPYPVRSRGFDLSINEEC